MTNSERISRLEKIAQVVEGYAGEPSLNQKISNTSKKIDELKLDIFARLDEQNKSIVNLEKKIDKIFVAYIVVVTVLTFIYYLIQTTDKLPMFTKPTSYENIMNYNCQDCL